MSESNVTINSGTREQVALDLMKYIVYQSNQAVYNSEEQILELYGKCKHAVAGSSARTGKVTGI